MSDIQTTNDIPVVNNDANISTEGTDQGIDQSSQESPFSTEQQDAINTMIAEASKIARLEQQKQDQSRFDREVTKRKQVESDLEELKTASMTKHNVFSSRTRN